MSKILLSWQNCVSNSQEYYFRSLLSKTYNVAYVSKITNSCWDVHIYFETNVIKVKTIRNLPSKKEAMQVADQFLIEDGWKLINDDKLMVLV